MVNKDKYSIGQKIREQRKRLNLTQFELAEKVGMHEKQISRIEAGLNHPTLDNFIKIIETLGLDFSDFDTKTTSKANKIKDDLMFIISTSKAKELKAYLDVIMALKENF